MKLNDFSQTKKFKVILVSLGVFIVLLLVFQLGVFVGFNKARFSFKWGDNYHKHFGGPKGGFLRDFEGRDFMGGHGIPGTIAKIDGNNLIIKDSQGTEKVIIVSAKTTIKKGTADLKISDLKNNDRLVVIGTPLDDGSTEAQLVRIFDPNDMPPPPSDTLKFKGRF